MVCAVPGPEVKWYQRFALPIGIDLKEGLVNLKDEMGDIGVASPGGQAVAIEASAELMHKPAPFRSRAGLALLVAVVIGAVGYGWIHRSGLNPKVPESVDVVPVPSMDSAKIDVMVQSLSARLQANPSDSAGWAMLARTLGVAGRISDAVAAYKRAVELSKNDAALLVDYADALAVLNNRSLSGEPLQLVQRALQIDARNLKGLAIMGKYAFDQGDYRTAVEHWERVVEYGPPDNLFVQQIQSELASARSKLGQSSPPMPAQPTVAPGTVGGTVSLAAKLAKSVSPEDTVFVTVRALGGTHLPLAVIRRQVRNLPFRFVIDDTMAMSSEAKISKATRVTVSARISKTGSPAPQPGDWVGAIGPVEVGSSALTLEIHEAFSP
jgi:cytochrome c-type biogenesis protein CcmH